MPHNFVYKKGFSSRLEGAGPRRFWLAKNEDIPVGTIVHNVEMNPGKGGQIARSAGIFAQLMAKEGKYATLRMPSGEMRLVLLKCHATIGQVGNLDHEIVRIGKAGKKRHMGIKPTVRGSVMSNGTRKANQAKVFQRGH